MEAHLSAPGSLGSYCLSSSGRTGWPEPKVKPAGSRLREDRSRQIKCFKLKHLTKELK